MKVYLLWCKYNKDWDWELIKIYKHKENVMNYFVNLECFDKFIDEMEIEDLE